MQSVKNIFLSIFLLLHTTAWAQYNNSSFLQSPNAASLGIYGSTDISPFTGLPNININVLSLKEKDIVIKADLRYFAGGVKPESHPGWVGQNWTLDIGGVVTRKVNGGVDEVAVSFFQDDKTFSYYYNYDVLSPNNWYSNSFIQNYWPNNSNQNLFKPVPAPDEFFFSLPTGSSGSFFLNHEGKWIVKSASEDKLIISVDVNSQPFTLGNYKNSNSKINIKRLIYKIVIIDKNGIKYTFGEQPNSIEFIRGPGGNFPNNEDVVANSWYLTKIEDTRGEVVNFEYQRKENQYIQGVSYTHTVGYSMTNYVDSYWGFKCSGFSLNPKVFGSQIITPSYLKEIRSNSFHIVFNIAETSELKYSYDTESFENYGYADLYEFTINADLLRDNPPKWYQLNNIQVFDNEERLKENYTFTYNNNPSERLFLKKFSKIGTSIENERIDYEFSYNETPLPSYNSLKIDEWGYYNGRSFPTNTGGLSASQVLYYLSPDAELMKAGTLTKIKYPTGGYTEFEYESNDYSKVLEKNGNSITLVNKTGIGGGIRIRKITDFTGDGQQYSKEYFYSSSQTPFTSSGILAGNKKVRYTYQIGNPALGYGDIITNNTLADLNYTNGRDVVYSEIKEKLQDNSYKIYKYSNSDNNYYKDEVPFNIYSDAYVGRKAYPQGSASHPSSYTYPLLSHTSRELERGKLLSLYSYNSDGVLVHKVINEYRDDPNRYNEFVRSFDDYAMKIECEYGIVNERYFQAIKIYTFFHHLKKQTEVTYDVNGQNPISIVANFNYDNNRNVKVKSVQNIDKTILTRYTYPYDYPSNSSIAHPLEYRAIYPEMVNKNMISFPIETINSFIQNGVEKVVSGRLQLYSKNNNIVSPAESFSLTLNSPGEIKLTYESFWFTGGDNKEKYERDILYKMYDNSGNLLEYTLKGGQDNSCLWDYNNRYPIAKTENSGQADIAATSFESDGKGNWSYAGTPSVSGGAITGKKSYSLGSGQITKDGLAPYKKYIVSYWSKGEVNISAGSQSNILVGKTINGWTYHQITLTNASLITLSGNTYIDELRLYPEDAQMTTYTYEPLVGMTSQTDANNRTTYYEYDGLGRLSLIKDQDNNVVKKICYNYAGQQEDCGKTFYNESQSKTFIKNCSGNQMGSPYVYIVPAKKYAGKTLNEANQQALQEIDLLGQQTADDLGSCTSEEILVRFESPAMDFVDYVWIDDAPVNDFCISLEYELTGFLISTNLSLIPTKTYVATYWEYNCEGEIICYETEAQTLSDSIVEVRGNWKKHEIRFTNATGNIGFLVNTGWQYFQDFKIKSE